MKPKTAPTSPKYNLEQAEKTLTTVWKQPEIQPPARLPLVSLAIWSLAFSILSIILIVVGLGWYIRMNPDSRIKSILPASVTTVIQNVAGGVSVEPPSEVRNTTQTVVALVATDTKEGIITDAHLVGTALALSSDGWLVTTENAWPSNVKLAASLSDRSIATLRSSIHDPASPFIFTRAETTKVRPAEFASSESVKFGDPVWVIVQRLSAVVALRRQLLPPIDDWHACDEIQSGWTLDEPVNAPAGSPIVTSNGKVLGLLGTTSTVWPVSMIESILPSLFDQGKVERPSCGFQFVSSSAATTSKNTTAEGLVIGAGADQPAIAPKSPAEKAGLRSGDIITAVDGRNLASWNEVLRAARPGKTIELSVRRTGKDVRLRLTFGVLKP